MKNDFIRAMFGTTTAREVVAVFKNGTQATYTAEILEALKADAFVECVYDAETGEIL